MDPKLPKIPADAVTITVPAEVADEYLAAQGSFSLGVTADLVKRIEAVIKAGQAAPALGEEGRIKQAVRFANTRSREAWELLQAGARPPRSVLKEWCSTPEDGRRTNSETGKVTTRLEREYRELRECLRLVAEKKVDGRRKAEWQRHAGGLLIHPGTGHIIICREHEIGPSSPVADVLCRLLERGDLGMCRWCGKFFLAKSRGRGRTVRRYCPATDHDEQAFKAGAAERKARSRRELAKKSSQRVNTRARPARR